MKCEFSQCGLEGTQRFVVYGSSYDVCEDHKRTGELGNLEGLIDRVTEHRIQQAEV